MPMGDSTRQANPSPHSMRSNDEYALATEAEDSLVPYVAALRRHVRALIAIPTILAVAIAAASFAIPRKYVARASFVPQEPSSSRSSLNSIAAQFGLSNLGAIAGAVGGGTGASPQFYAELLRSRQVLHTVVTTRYESGGPDAFRGTLVEYYKSQRADSQETVLRAMKVLNERALKVDFDRQTGIVRLSVSMKDRVLAAQVARRFLDLVNEFNVRRRRTTVSAERDFAESRTAEALAELRRAESELAQFHSSNRAFDGSPNLALVEGRLRRRVTLTQQVYTGLAQQFETARIEAVRETPVITIIDAPEGLVEAQPRGTVGKAFLGLALGVVLVSGWAVFDAARRRRLESAG